MRQALMISLTLLVVGNATPASADDYPKIDVAPLCHGITQQSDLQEGFRDVTFDQCMKAEQEDRDAIIKDWKNFSAADKTHCVAEATMGGESSYTELLTCLEMARDVRLLDKSEQPDQSIEATSQNQSKHVRNPRRKPK